MNLDDNAPGDPSGVSKENEAQPHVDENEAGNGQASPSAVDSGAERATETEGLNPREGNGQASSETPKMKIEENGDPKPITNTSTELPDGAMRTIKTNAELEKDIFDKLSNALQISVDFGSYLYLDKETGEILGPKAEGTLATIFYLGNVETLNQNRQRLGKADALRIPRLLQGDDLLNLHIAEIVYNESAQANRLPAATHILKPKDVSRFDLNRSTISVGDKDNNRNFQSYFVGFYLSPNTRYKAAVISETDAWPEDFKQFLLKNGGPDAIVKVYHKLLDTENLILQNVNARAQGRGMAQSADKIDNLIYIPFSKASSGGQTARNISTKAGDASGVNVAARSTTRQEPGDGMNEKHQAWIDEQVILFNRSEMDRIAYDKKLGGWWFLLPKATFEWLNVNLDRFLLVTVDEVVSGRSSSSMDQQRKPEMDPANAPATARTWQREEWIGLVESLTKGLTALHGDGALHGDMRPANIMAALYGDQIPSPDDFRWIDIGLGYSNSHAAPGETKFSPGPLGGRATVFYAPERGEAKEHEDFDQVSLAEENNCLILKFFTHTRTDIPAQEPASLKGEGMSLSPIAEMKEGDKIQIREFLFEVKDVKTDYVEVARIYHIMMDRVLIQAQRPDGRRGTPDEHIITTTKCCELFNNTPISRYRIFQQWSEASDIYSLGVLALFIFFNYGITEYFKIIDRNKDNNDKNGDPRVTGAAKKDLALGRRLSHRSARQKIFDGFIEVMLNPKFLSDYCDALSGEGFKDATGLFGLLSSEGQDTLQSRVKDLEKVRRSALHHAPDLELLYYAMGGNDLLFTLATLFCLSCLYRKDDLPANVSQPNQFMFTPFSDDRLRIASRIKKDDDLKSAAAPAGKAYKFLHDLKNLSIVIGILMDNGNVQILSRESMHYAAPTSAEPATGEGLSSIDRLAEEQRKIEKLKRDLQIEKESRMEAERLREEAENRLIDEEVKARQFGIELMECEERKKIIRGKMDQMLLAAKAAEQALEAEKSAHISSKEFCEKENKQRDYRINKLSGNIDQYIKTIKKLQGDVIDRNKSTAECRAYLAAYVEAVDKVIEIINKIPYSRKIFGGNHLDQVEAEVALKIIMEKLTPLVQSP